MIFSLQEQVEIDLASYGMATVDASVGSPLDWQEQKERGMKMAEEGKRILWDVDLGLHRHLPFTLSDKGQLATLQLAMEHFFSFLWTPLAMYSVGVIIYRGEGSFHDVLSWDEEVVREWEERMVEKGEEEREFLRSLFCRDLCLDYLQRIVGASPEELRAFLWLDMASVKDPLLHTLLLASERYEAFFPLVENVLFSLPDPQAKGALLLPPEAWQQSSYWEPYRPFVESMLQRKIPFRVISEERFHQEWGELDWVAYQQEALSREGERKLCGFTAAGGESWPLTHPMI